MGCVHLCRSAPGTEGLTQLGRHLAALPLQPAAGKLLLYGLLFRCLDPMLTIACGLAYRHVLATQVLSSAAMLYMLGAAPVRVHLGLCRRHA